ncbi:DUF1415 domain-containing protein [Dyella tabacisoli]|uniref:DUF1415 domain-containing protein n=1 Tax=Dyella tabacisoli TaxID=2282381 RepID=A0A369UP28_9GAMM|nr:DUF1415 domain-containing protein [Dyella tabacisoli]RDD81795.1 DUF1415 domain-containing protein [Dyella tabacisoli]
MTQLHSASPFITAGIQADDLPYIEATRRWVERAVVGLNLCPFARAPLVQQKIRFAVSHARDADTLLDDLCGELQSLAAADAGDCETTLLIHPFALGDFLDYNDFLDVADAAVETLGLEGELQVASFHPQYQFADSAIDDIENFSNRSPYPTLHLLRESSVERAMDAMTDTDEIFRRNADTLKRLGPEGWQALWRND